jgi:phage baseplate assembly protein W
MAKNNDRFTAMSRDSQAYSDFLTDLNPHPVSGDIVKYINENAVIRSIRNLLLTNKFDRLYQPTIGTDIQKMLFEPIGYVTAQNINLFVQQTIKDFEPRAKVLKIDVVSDEENHRYLVNLVVLIINKQDPISFSITLDRIR